MLVNKKPDGEPFQLASGLITREEIDDIERMDEFVDRDLPTIPKQFK